MRIRQDIVRRGVDANQKERTGGKDITKRIPIGIAQPPLRLGVTVIG